MSYWYFEKWQTDIFHPGIWRWRKGAIYNDYIGALNVNRYPFPYNVDNANLPEGRTLGRKYGINFDTSQRELVNIWQNVQTLHFSAAHNKISFQLKRRYNFHLFALRDKVDDHEKPTSVNKQEIYKRNYIAIRERNDNF